MNKKRDGDAICMVDGNLLIQLDGRLFVTIFLLALLYKKLSA
jgi:hypothetical protein